MLMLCLKLGQIPNILLIPIEISFTITMLDSVAKIFFEKFPVNWKCPLHLLINLQSGIDKVNCDALKKSCYVRLEPWNGFFIIVN